MQFTFLFNNFFNKGHERSIKAKKNIAASFIIKGANIAIGLALVPLTIDYLNPTKYGIWITLSSIIAWVNFFDIGLGHGLRNRFAEALASGNQKLAKTYVSTTYAILSLIVSGIIIIFFIVNPVLNWNKILNAGDAVSKGELSLLALIVFTFFCLQFIFRLITTILLADQQPAKASLFDFFAKFLSLGIIYILTKITYGSLIYLGFVISGLPVLVLAVTSIWLYNSKYKQYRPDFKTIDFSKAKDLLNLGVKFFIIQIAAILLYQTNNIIITQLFGPAMVTPYNVAFKYFSILMMVFMIIINPFWSAFTEAWTIHDIEWIKRIMKKLMLIWLVLFVSGLIMFLFSGFIFRIWIGKDFSVPIEISFLTLCWVLINAWNGIFGQFLNGVSKIKFQLSFGILIAVINIPLALFLGGILGISGVLLANVILGFIGALIYPLQYKKLITNKASGIWNK